MSTNLHHVAPWGNQTNSTCNKNQSFTSRVLGKLLPRRMKRLIFVSSFIAHLRNTTDPDRDLLSKINKLLSLSNRDEALLLPIQLHQQIWSKVFLKEVFQEKSINFDDISQIASFKFHKPQIRTLSEEIIKVIPSWLMYGSRNQVKNDLVCIFENMGVLFQKA